MGMPRGVPSAMTPKENVAFRPGASGSPGGAVPSARNRAGVRTIVCPPARVVSKAAACSWLARWAAWNQAAKIAPGGAVERLAAGQSARLVMQRQRGARECRQQQHAEQRARPACISAYARHPKMNPISLAPSPSSQAAVIWAAVTGEVRAAPLIVIEITPARARLRPA